MMSPSDEKRIVAMVDSFTKTVARISAEISNGQRQTRRNITLTSQ